MSATARAAGRVEPRRIAVPLAMSSLMTENVIDHAGPLSDHPNPVIDKVLTEAISRTKRTSNCSKGALRISHSDMLATPGRVGSAGQRCPSAVVR
jgi:hypothetical protein